MARRDGLISTQELSDMLGQPGLCIFTSAKHLV